MGYSSRAKDKRTSYSKQGYAAVIWRNQPAGIAIMPVASAVERMVLWRRTKVIQELRAVQVLDQDLPERSCLVVLVVRPCIQIRGRPQNNGCASS